MHWPKRLSTLLALLSLPTFALAVRAEAPESKPNVVLILADDLGQRDLGCYGSSFYETPQLDRLAAVGVRFTQAYAACPVCSPTRGALMTGKHPPRFGVTDFIGGTRRGKLNPAPNVNQLPLEEVTLAEALKAAGYTTGMAGKWHLGGDGFLPPQQGFDESEPPNSGGWNNLVERGDRVTDFALRFIESHRAEPFFLYLPHNLVHVPLKTKPELQAKYEAKTAALQLPPGAARFRPQGPHQDRRVQDHAVYAAMMEDLDTQVGRVLAKLDELNLTDRTIVIFTSDNGGLSTAEGSPTSNAPLRAGKGWLYEGGLRVPLVVRGPNSEHGEGKGGSRIKPGNVCNEPVITTDLYPTLLELCGLPARTDRHRDGVSLVPLLRGADSLAARQLFWHYPHNSNQGGTPASAIRDGDWKLIEFLEDDHVELYNVANDIGEGHDLAATMPDKARALRAELAAWRESVGAKMPTPNPDYKPPGQ